MVAMPYLELFQLWELGQKAALGVVGRRHIDADIRKMSQLTDLLKLLYRKWRRATCHQPDSVPLIINGNGITPCFEKLNDVCFVST